MITPTLTHPLHFLSAVNEGSTSVAVRECLVCCPGQACDPWYASGDKLRRLNLLVWALATWEVRWFYNAHHHCLLLGQ